MVEAQALPSPFMRSWWLDHAAVGRPTILLCTIDGELVGGAAFEIDRIGPGPASVERIRCLGQGVLAPDHLDLIATPGHHSAVARAVIGWMGRRGTRVVDLDGLAGEGTLATMLSPYVRSRVAAPFVELADGAQHYLESLPGPLRSTIRRSGRRFERQGAGPERVATDEIGAALDDLARLHEHRWADGSPFLKGWARARAAFLAGAEHGDVEAFVLRAPSGDAIAVELDLLAGDRLAFYQAGRRTDHEWRGCGSVLRAHIVQAAVADGMAEYDMLRGDETYKADWATGRREVLRCVMTKGIRAKVAFRAQTRKHERAAPERRAINP